MRLSTRKIVYSIFILVLLGFGVFFCKVYSVSEWVSGKYQRSFIVNWLSTNKVAKIERQQKLGEMDCKAKGGKIVWQCGIFCTEGGRSCVLPYPKAEKKCDSSADCGNGKCVLSIVASGSQRIDFIYPSTTSVPQEGEILPLQWIDDNGQEVHKLFECSALKNKGDWSDFSVHCSKNNVVEQRCQKYPLTNCENVIEYLGETESGLLKVREIRADCSIG